MPHLCTTVHTGMPIERILRASERSWRFRVPGPITALAAVHAVRFAAEPMSKFPASGYTMRRLATFKFRLYVADHARNSLLAIANLNALCRTHLPDRHEIEVVDVFREPKRALEDGIFLTPTLVKFEPSPKRSVVGTLSQTQSVLHALGLESSAG